MPRFPLQEERGFLPDLSAIPSDVADRAEMMWLNYPNNPTGAVADFAFFSEAAAFAREHGILLCHDAPYADVTYDGYRPLSLLQVPGAADVTVEFNSLSKTYNMAGWRIGMAVGNPHALSLLSQVKSNIDSGIFAPLQDAAVRALCVGEDWIASRNAVYRERLALVLEGLSAIGLSAPLPLATPYLWVRVPSGWGSEPFALALLGEVGVSIAPGSFFGPAGEGCVRLSATAPTERIREAAERLRRMPRGWILGRPSR
jgi:LL-diaminopimelate aminotransferase